MHDVSGKIKEAILAITECEKRQIKMGQIRVGHLAGGEDTIVGSAGHWRARGYLTQAKGLLCQALAEYRKQ